MWKYVQRQVGACGVSTATWVAGTPKASIPDFTEPPEAPECSSVPLTCCTLIWNKNNIKLLWEQIEQTWTEMRVSMNNSYKSDDLMPECV